MSALTPVAEGTLEATPFAHLLISLQKRKMTGTLAVWPDDERPGQDRILVRAGVPVAARLLEPSESLERGLLPLFRRARAPYAFYESDLVGEGADVVGGSVETTALIAAGLRGGGRDETIAQVLAGFGAEPVRVGRAFDASAFRLMPKETAVVDLIRAEPAPTATIAQRSGDEKVARRVLYLLAITGLLERFRPPAANLDDSLPMLDAPAVTTMLANARSAPMPAPTAPPSATGTARPSKTAVDRLKKRGLAAPDPAPTPPESLTPEQRSRWDELGTRAAAADQQTYFDLLGIDETASADDVRHAYFDIIKRLHPDRLTQELATLRPWAERLFQLLTEAKETLENQDKRLKYVSTIRNGGGTPESDRKMMIVLQAAHELEKAAVLANMGKWNEALETIDDVKALDPTQSDIYALEAWALMHVLGQHPAATPETVVGLCDRVLSEARDGYHERACYTKGLALKKLGKDEAAYELFRSVSEHNARHLDAAREVRLYEMRRRDAGKPVAKANPGQGTEAGGLFAKLFNNKKP